LNATIIATFCNSDLIPLSEHAEDWPSPNIGKTHKHQKTAQKKPPKFEERPDLGTVAVIDPFAGTSSAGCSALLLGVDFVGGNNNVLLIFLHPTGCKIYLFFVYFFTSHGM
jgi:hypothetical protein